VIFPFTCVFIPKDSKNVFQVRKSLSAASNTDESYLSELGKKSKTNHRMWLVRFRFAFDHILKIQGNEQIWFTMAAPHERSRSHNNKRVALTMIKQSFS
jgi:hypothetical protein